MITFDERGYLKPYEVVLLDWDTFVECFIFNDNRAKLFDAFLLFIKQLEGLEPDSFFLWINGSFISKKEKPEDLDIVVFLKYQFYEALEKDLRALKHISTHLDCYFVKVYPQDHPSRFLTEFDQIEWLHLFSTDRKKNPKGFVQLNF